jgi:putative endonuclease
LENHYVYVLKSLKNNTYYKGRTSDLNKRLNEHNKGKTISTKSGIPWIIVYFETLPTLDEAIIREKYFKTAAGRRYLKSKIPE